MIALFFSGEKSHDKKEIKNEKGEILMKDKRTAKIDIRVTPEEKELIKEYAAKHDMKVSELIRSFCYKALIKKTK